MLTPLVSLQTCLAQNLAGIMSATSYDTEITHVEGQELRVSNE